MRARRPRSTSSTRSSTTAPAGRSLRSSSVRTPRTCSAPSASWGSCLSLASTSTWVAPRPRCIARTSAADSCATPLRSTNSSAPCVRRFLDSSPSRCVSVSTARNASTKSSRSSPSIRSISSPCTAVPSKDSIGQRWITSPSPRPWRPSPALSSLTVTSPPPPRLSVSPLRPRPTV